jgi:hypothetical protein
MARIMLVVRLALLPVSLAVAGLSFLHAASEVEAVWLGEGAAGRLGLDAHIASAVVDSGFRVEMASRQQQTQSEFPPLPGSLIKLAQDSFAADPLEVTSIRTVALGSTLQHDEDRARRIMRLALQISKRDGITDLWLAQDYGRAGDVENMIATFDHALRISERAREFAMKAVVDALASEESHVPLGTLLARRPEWEDDFWEEFARNPVAAANATAFFVSSGLSVNRLPDVSRERFYMNLKRQGQFETLFRLVDLDSQAEQGQDAHGASAFTTADQGDPLGWTLRSQGNYAARINGKTGELQIDARAGSFGLAADRIIRGGGNLSIAIRMSEGVPENARLKLAARCASSLGPELGSVSLDRGEKAGQAVVSAANCDFVVLELSFAADPGRHDALFRIAQIVAGAA